MFDDLQFVCVECSCAPQNEQTCCCLDSSHRKVGSELECAPEEDSCRMHRLSEPANYSKLSFTCCNNHEDDLFSSVSGAKQCQNDNDDDDDDEWKFARQKEEVCERVPTLRLGEFSGAIWK